MWTLRDSWTAGLVRDCGPHMSMASLLRCRNYLLRERSGKLQPNARLTLKMRGRMKVPLALREQGSDFNTFWDVFIHGVYRDVTNAVPDCRTIIDVGANIGLASLYFAAHFPNCRLFCVEPHPGTYAVLVDNLKPLIDAGRCRTLAAAVWDRDELLGPAQDVDNDHYTTFAVDSAAAGDAHGGGISGRTMDAIIAESGFDTVDLVKIDVEGAEARLFRSTTWLHRVRAVAIEFHGKAREESRFDEVMAQLGFVVEDRGGHTVIARRPDRRQ